MDQRRGMGFFFFRSPISSPTNLNNAGSAIDAISTIKIMGSSLGARYQPCQLNRNGHSRRSPSASQRSSTKWSAVPETQRARTRNNSELNDALANSPVVL